MNQHDANNHLAVILMNLEWAKGKARLIDTKHKGSVLNESQDLISSLEDALQAARELRKLAEEDK